MRFRPVFVLSLATLLFGGSAVQAQARSEEPRADAAPAKPPVPKCITVTAYVVNSAPGFDHVVRLESQCERDAACEVSTDVAPEKIAVELPAGQMREVVTFRGAPGYGFEPRVTCELSK